MKQRTSIHCRTKVKDTWWLDIHIAWRHVVRRLALQWRSKRPGWPEHIFLPSFWRGDRIFCVQTCTHLNCALTLLKHMFHRLFMLHWKSRSARKGGTYFCCFSVICCSRQLWRFCVQMWLSTNNFICLQSHNLRSHLFLTVHNQSPTESIPKETRSTVEAQRMWTYFKMLCFENWSFNS